MKVHPRVKAALLHPAMKAAIVIAIPMLVLSLDPPYTIQILCLAFFMFGMAIIFIVDLLPNMLSDEQRYGIDSHGNAKTPEYMKRQREWAKR